MLPYSRSPIPGDSETVSPCQYRKTSAPGRPFPPPSYYVSESSPRLPDTNATAKTLRGTSQAPTAPARLIQYDGVRYDGHDRRSWPVAVPIFAATEKAACPLVAKRKTAKTVQVDMFCHSETPSEGVPAPDIP